MLSKIIKVKGDWEEVVDDCRSTAGKPPLGKEPSEQFKRGILIAEHSPIRNISIKWKWTNIPSWVATHFSRHKWECYIKSQRTDRTGIPRDILPQAAPVDFTGEANCQHLIDTMRKRLCRKASDETRYYAEDLKTAIHEVQPELADVLCPSCVYRAGCPEVQPCGWYANMLKQT
ncbi:MAG: FAD-dependent thymidylate synthase, partial [Bacteroidaceae bacterium]|nr:FAD-dependent thymidylate synthase [Bacteroidaceae bacterium]